MRMCVWIAVAALTGLVSIVRGQIPNCTLDDYRLMDTDLTVDPALRVVNIDCLISEGELWDFSLLKGWTAAHSVGPVHVSITCQPGGSVYLRRPIKANHLERLHINSCKILGTDNTDLSVKTHQQNFTLRQLIIEDSNIVLSKDDIWTYYMEHYQQNLDLYPCSYPPSLEQITLRNNNEDIQEDKVWVGTEYDKFKKTVENFTTNKRECTFSDLHYLELSGADGGTTLYEQFLHKCIYPSLKVMNISRLLLKRSPDKLSKHRWYIDFPKLERIDLSHNRITDMDFASAPPDGRSLEVDLSYNQISILHQPSIQNLYDFYPGLVNLRGNRWVCNCSQRDFVRFLQEEDGTIIDDYAYLGEAKCSRPVSRVGQYMKNAEDLCGRKTSEVPLPNLVLYICLPLLVLCFFVLIILVRFRREIRVLVFTRFTSVNSCLFVPVPTTSNGIEKDFDAFVSYSSLDETWVHDMCRRLEESAHQFRLCLHHKHFVPGACISDNIIDSVERSRHTIMVLSPNFLKSEWCILEFRKAFHQSLMENERHLVVVMLEGFDESCVQSDLKHFLKTYTYIKASDFLFWDKLVFALSKSRDDHKYIRHSDSAQDKKASEAFLSVVKSV